MYYRADLRIAEVTDHNERGVALLMSGDYDKARSHFQEVLKGLNKDDKEARLTVLGDLAQVYNYLQD